MPTVKKISTTSRTKKTLRGSLHDFLPKGCTKKANSRKNVRIVDLNIRTSKAPKDPQKRSMIVMEIAKVLIKKAWRRWIEKPFPPKNDAMILPPESSFISSQSIPFFPWRLLKKLMKRSIFML